MIFIFLEVSFELIALFSDRVIALCALGLPGLSQGAVATALESFRVARPAGSPSAGAAPLLVFPSIAVGARKGRGLSIGLLSIRELG